MIRAQVIYVALVYPELGHHRIREHNLHEVSVLGAEYGQRTAGVGCGNPFDGFWDGYCAHGERSLLPSYRQNKW
ncbi:hypothetical protein [Microbulbifer variabilis]|uniref:hypothetical protein n=1 Tax=Microbulbifer variabilis TaxID=266805 RepID=UPI00037BCCDB|nr:hypothetical protein [Microbulbifer variabilis]